MKAISVATWRVHRSEQRLQTDVANQLIIHLVLVLVQVIVLALVLLTTLLTYLCPQQSCRAAAAAARNLVLCCSHWLKALSPNVCVSSYLLEHFVWYSSEVYICMSTARTAKSTQTVRMIQSQQCHLHFFILIFC